MANNASDELPFLQVPLYNSSYNIKDDPNLPALLDGDPYVDVAGPQVYALAILSAFSIILIMPTFIWHIRKGQLPASCLIFWALWLNLVNLVSALIWPNDNIGSWFWGYGYCDIAVKMDIASGLGIVGAVVCILRSLAAALDTNRIRVMSSRPALMRQRVIEIVFCFGLPILQAVLHVFVQSRRYYIYAISGCMYTVGETWVDVLFIWLWPPILALVAGYYALVVLVRVIKYRREFSEVLSASTSGMSKARFSRLYTISGVLLLVYLPAEIYVFIFNVTLTPLGPYSWSQIHSPVTWDYLLFFPSYGQVFFDRWIYASLGYAVFFTIGLGADMSGSVRRALLLIGLGKIFPRLQKPINFSSKRSRSRHTDSTNGTLRTDKDRRAGWLSKFSFVKQSLSSKNSTYNGTETHSVTELVGPDRQAYARSYPMLDRRSKATNSKPSATGTTSSISEMPVLGPIEEVSPFSGITSGMRNSRAMENHQPTSMF